MRDWFRLSPFLAAACAWIAVVQHDPFFWDTIQLASKHAHFFYNNGLRWAPLPPDIDSGHPPAFGWLLALCWTVFGKTLPTGHWMMLPFLLGIVVILERLGRRLGGHEWGLWLLPLVLLDPVTAGQSALVSPDIALLFFFLLALNGLLAGSRLPVMLGILGLCTISMRGMMTAGALFAWTAADSLLSPLPAGRHRLLLFIPGFAVAAGFLAWHRIQTGWIGFHPDSPWAGAFQRVGWAGFAKNCLVLAWRWLDFGRVVEWAGLLVILYPRLRSWTEVRSRAVGGKWASLASLWLILTILLSVSALLYHNLSAHRYFLPAYVALHLFVFQQIARSGWPVWRKKLLFSVVVAGLATGNLWIYPRGISMDWDATLAHRPYHGLRADMVEYVKKEGIGFATVGSAFPNLGSGEQISLDGDDRRFAEKDFRQNRYMLASNVFNDFSAAELDELERDWILLKRNEANGVWLALYGNGDIFRQKFGQ